MSACPQISIIMPVYNTALYVEQAIRSILDQTFVDFELLIFNDGSKDNSSDIVRNISDSRIRFFDYNYNSGYVTHLNYGLKLARGEFIARMDSDDISLPERLAKQILYMRDNPEVGVCGTAFQMFGSQNTVFNMPIEDMGIREFMLLHNPLGHPTVMMRKSILEKYSLHYKHEFVPAEDYRMWYDFSKISLLGNLPEVLLKYRTHDKQISATMNDVQRSSIDNTRWAQLFDKGFRLSSSEISGYCSLLDYNYSCNSSEDFQAIVMLINNILNQNKKLQAFPQLWFEKLFRPRLRNIIYTIHKFNPKYIFPLFYRNSRAKNLLDFTESVNLFVKSLIFWKIRI